METEGEDAAWWRKYWEVETVIIIARRATSAGSIKSSHTSEAVVMSDCRG
jgi:hypothetical protein